MFGFVFDMSASRRSAAVSSCRPKCRSEIWAIVRTLLRQGVPDRAFDFERSLHGGARHHAFVMSRQAGEVGEVRLQRIYKAPIEPKQMDIGDRITPDCPFAPGQSLLGDAEHLSPAFGTDAPGRVDRRCDERHPRYRLRFGFEAPCGPESGFGKAFGEIIEDR